MCVKLKAEGLEVSRALWASVVWSGSVMLGKWEVHTRMIQMALKVPITMSSCGDMEITLHLVPLQAPINPTRVNHIPPPQLRTLRKLAARVMPHLTEHMAHMSIRLLLHTARLILLVQCLVLVASVRKFLVALVHPQLPGGGLTLEHLAG